MTKVYKKRDEDAVSPVIATILMVAITVILAAIIAAFVFGMTDTMQSNYVVSATASQISDTEIQAIYYGGSDSQYVESIILTVTNETGTIFTNTLDNPPIGSVLSVDGEFAGQDTVILVGNFTDGKQQIILNSRL